MQSDYAQRLVSAVKLCVMHCPHWVTLLLLHPPLPPLGHIWYVMLVWRKGNINKNCLCVTVLCTIIMVQIRAVLTGWSSVSGFNLAWFSSLFSKHLCLWSSWCYICIKNFQWCKQDFFLKTKTKSLSPKTKARPRPQKFFRAKTKTKTFFSRPRLCH